MRTRLGIGTFVAVTALLVVLAAGCGGSSKKSSASGTTTATTSAATTTMTATTSGGGTVALPAWADAFCSAVGSWGNSMKSVGTALRAHPTKANLQGAVATIKNANQTLVAALQSLGTPNTQGGAQAKAAIDSLATALKSHSDQINSAIKSSAGAQELKTSAMVISTNLIAMGDAFKSSLSQLKSMSKSAKGSFKQAFQQSSACQKLKREAGA